VARIGITCDTAAIQAKDSALGGFRYESPASYADAIEAAGGTPLILPFCFERIDDYLALCDGFVFAGGDDPDTHAFGVDPHPHAKLVHPRRQAFELALLKALEQTEQPVLGICLGMQWMALHHGGELDQHLPDTHDPAVAAAHADGDHPVERLEHQHSGLAADGLVHSHHRQAITDSGRMRVCARSDAATGSLIEAVDLDSSRFYLGVQWHPERTGKSALGSGIFDQLVAACP
jgi:putative glutamine amidotransferase